jgi:hypothetical protein
MDFSGLERDKLFLSTQGKGFIDASYLSGMDDAQDGRTFAYADLDHDGAEDIILTNRNAPILVIYRNTSARGNWIGLHLTGDGRHSNPDAVGSRVAVRCGESTVTRVVEIGTGFAIQNSKTLTLGVGSCQTIDELKVQWPGGQEQVFNKVAAREYYELTEGKTLELVPGYYPTASQVSASVPSPKP